MKSVLAAPTNSTLNPTRPAGTLSTYPRKDGRLSWPWCWLYPKMVYLSVGSRHPSSNHLMVSRLGIKLLTIRL